MQYSIKKRRLPPYWRWRLHPDGAGVIEGCAFSKTAAKRAAQAAAKRLAEARRRPFEPVEAMGEHARDAEARWTPTPRTA